MEDGKTIWGIHSYDDNLFLKKDTLGLGWANIGDLSAIEPTREAFKSRYAEAFPDDKPAAIPGSAGMLYRFLYEMQEGDYVVFPSKSDRMVNIGLVDSPALAELVLKYYDKMSERYQKLIPLKMVYIPVPLEEE